MGIIKPGRVVIVLAGRFAGRKGVVIKASSDDASDSKRFGQAVIAGIDRYPRKVVKAMKKEKVEKRCKIKPFVKVLNFNHLMPTRYTVDFDLKKLVDDDALSTEKRVDTRKLVKKVFEERYKNQSVKNEKKAGGVSYFFKKLRF